MLIAFKCIMLQSEVLHLTVTLISHHSMKLPFYLCKEFMDILEFQECEAKEFSQLQYLNVGEKVISHYLSLRFHFHRLSSQVNQGGGSS